VKVPAEKSPQDFADFFRPQEFLRTFSGYWKYTAQDARNSNFRGRGFRRRTPWGIPLHWVRDRL